MIRPMIKNFGRRQTVTIQQLTKITHKSSPLKPGREFPVFAKVPFQPTMPSVTNKHVATVIVRSQHGQNMASITPPAYAGKS